MVDQLSQKWLEVALNGACPVPNIKKLCDDGVMFTNAITSNPVCCPARATIATGLTTRGHGVLENGYQLSPEIPTFMQSLQKNGWRTSAVGKVHFHPHFAGLNPNYKPFGFDNTHITEDACGGEWLDWVEKEYPQYYENVLLTIWPTAVPEFSEYGPDKRNLRERIERIRQSAEWKTDKFPNNTPFAYTLPFSSEVSQTEWITKHALHLINEAVEEKPIYLHISYVQPHGPFHPPAEYMQHVNTDLIPKPEDSEWVNDSCAPMCFKSKKPSNRDWEYNRHCYFADIVHLDKQLGIIMDKLKEIGKLNNTYIIFLSDHGELLGDHGFYGKEERHYDACVRVPVIISGPGINKGLECDDIVQLEDICPTVLDMAGLKPERLPKMGPYLNLNDEDIPVFPGKSLLKLCTGEKIDNWRPAAYCESYNRISSIDPRDWGRTIRTKRYRYTYYPQNGGEQLFDLAADKGEQYNLAGDQKFTDIKKKLKDQLMELIIMQDYPKTRRELFALGVH